jgi:prepilin-type N-terminal cleavage/methylation domain-containing protein
MFEQKRMNRKANEETLLCRRPSRRRREGFSLVEVMVAVVIVGVGIAASMHGIATNTIVTAEGRNVLFTGGLADNVKQFCQTLSFADPQGGTVYGPDAGETGIGDYDDVDDLDGATFSPPIGGDGSTLSSPSYAIWSQAVTVVGLDSGTYNVLVPPGDTPFKRITVEVFKGTRSLGTYEWILTRWGD